jgi:hypothetical protein
MDTNKKIPKNPQSFSCLICNYNTSNSKDYNKHCLTQKHKRLTNTNILSPISPINPKLYNCVCGNVYKHMSSLCKHKKTCCCKINTTDKEDDDENMYQGINIKDKDALVLHLLKQNGELQNKIIEIASYTNITNTNSLNNNNNNNKTFNLQFFLNDTCKNAMNITDFVSNIKLDLNDLENTGRQGYIQGITNIILKNLNNLEQHMRPLHCSDFKREVLYIKDNNEWTKETNNKPILTTAIKTIANKNIKQINQWKDTYPDCVKSDSKKNDLYLKIVSNSMNGLTKEEGEHNINKIITNIAKQVVIEK